MARAALRGLKGGLVKNSIDAFVLAIETVNKLSGGYRAESFTFLIVNAWELLLKARIIEIGGRTSIFETRLDFETKRKVVWSISISKCLRILFPDENEPIRLNLEQVIKDRDRATHLVLPRISNEQLAVYQACVVNYNKLLMEWFEYSLSERISFGMMTIVFDTDARKFDLTDTALKRSLGREGLDYLLRRQAELRILQEKTNYSIEFAAEIHHQVSIVANPKNADVSLESGADGATVGVVDKPRDHAQTHPFRMSITVLEIKKRLPASINFNSHDIKSIGVKYNIHKRTNFYYRSQADGSVPYYSQEFIDWVVEQVYKDPSFLKQCRRENKEILSKKAKSNEKRNYILLPNT